MVDRYGTVRPTAAPRAGVARMNTANRARIARARAQRLGLRLSQRGSVFRLYDEGRHHAGRRDAGRCRRLSDRQDEAETARAAAKYPSVVAALDRVRAELATLLRS
jgi:hypothetical protein